MRWLRVATVAAALLCAAPTAIGAQPAATVSRIGVLDSVDAASNAANLDAFRQAMGTLGHVEGQSFVIEYRSADGRTERFRDLALELVRQKVDLIVTRGTPAAHAARHATTTIPIVMATSGDPVSEGIVASFARPGGNITGLHMLVPPDLGGRRLQLLREVVPGATRVGVLWNSADIQSPFLMRDTEKVARAIGAQLKSLDVQRPEGFEPAFETTITDPLDALIVVEDYLTFAERDRVVNFAAMSRLPAIYGLREFMDAGGLMSYGVDRRDLFRRAAGYVDRILKGARPADLPVEPPTRFELAVNLKTARALGLTLPPSLLQRADHVVH